MGKVFAKYIVTGNEEDMVAFETILRHISWCIMVGSSRDITISVDGDGSASLRFLRDDKEQTLDPSELHSDDLKPLEYPNDIRNKIFNGEEVNFGIMGTVKADGNAEFSIGE